MPKERNSLYILLSTFSDAEWREFERFVASPYFNDGRNHSMLMKILSRNRPDFNSDELTKVAIYRKLFPGKPYKESVMYSTFSRISKLAEEYMIHKELESDEKFSRERLKLSAYARRKLSAKAPALIEKLSGELKAEKFKVTRSFNLKELAKEIASYYYEFDQRRLIPEYVHMILKYSLCWYLTESSMFYSSLISQKTYDKEESENNISRKLRSCIDFEKALEILKEDDPEFASVLRMHYLSIKARDIPFDDRAYFELKELVFRMLGKMQADYKQYWLNNVAEICSMRFVAGDQKYKREAFEIRKKTVEEDLFSYNSDGAIRLSEFRSTFTEALNVKELEWAEQFSAKYVSRLNPLYRKDAELYCSARIAYERNDIDKAIELLMKVNLDQVYYKLDIKNLLAKAYYDTGSVEPLHSLLNTYYQFIRNSGKSNEVIFTRHLNFVKYLRKLAVLKFERRNINELTILKKELEKEIATSKSWLIRKMEEL